MFTVCRKAVPFRPFYGSQVLVVCYGHAQYILVLYPLPERRQCVPVGPLQEQVLAHLLQLVPLWQFNPRDLAQRSRSLSN